MEVKSINTYLQNGCTIVIALLPKDMMDSESSNISKIKFILVSQLYYNLPNDFHVLREQKGIRRNKLEIQHKFTIHYFN